MEIKQILKHNKRLINSAARILNGSLPLGYPTHKEAICEVRECLDNGLIFGAIEEGELVGWGGIIGPSYSGNVFELHPLVVEQSKRGKGIGQKIVSELEKEARRLGGLMMYLGADDEKEPAETSLAHTDLFDNLSYKIKHFIPGSHQSAFYMKIGYKIIGVMPDANGRGKPDILLGKKL